MDGRNVLQTLDQLVDFIIKLDKPYLSFSSLSLYRMLEKKGKLAGRPDLQKKGISLLEKYLVGNIDKYLLRHNHDMK